MVKHTDQTEFTQVAFITVVLNGVVTGGRFRGDSKFEHRYLELGKRRFHSAILRNPIDLPAILVLASYWQPFWSSTPAWYTVRV